jgi:hypothetical protein
MQSTTDVIAGGRTLTLSVRELSLLAALGDGRAASSRARSCNSLRVRLRFAPEPSQRFHNVASSR